MKLVFLLSLMVLCLPCKASISTSDYSTFGSSESEKGFHIPEATPKYSETSAVVGESSTWGKGAYKAFNGQIFSFESSCTYTFCRHCVESGSYFNIEIKRNNQNDIEKITVLIDGNDISISGKTILVNGESVHVPFDNKLIHIKHYGDYTKLESRRGILFLMWNSKDKLSLTLHKPYATCGLCGQLNDVPGENIDENIANSKISEDCPKAIAKQYEECEDGKRVVQWIVG
ncbi:mucin-19-like [Macrotis lagotis]|uniref:mucin-19-like n=1 Tax=Macrotis lagotis TaxID=92651 RepID=UPI003D69452C